MSHVSLPRSIVHSSCDSCPYCPSPSSSQRTAGTQTPAVALGSWSFNRQSSVINRPFTWSAYPEWSWLSIDSRRPAAAYSQPMLAPLAEEGPRLLWHVFQQLCRLSGVKNDGEGSGPWGMPWGMRPRSSSASLRSGKRMSVICLFAGLWSRCRCPVPWSRGPRGYTLLRRRAGCRSAGSRRRA